MLSENGRPQLSTSDFQVNVISLSLAKGKESKEDYSGVPKREPPSRCRKAS